MSETQFDAFLAKQLIEWLETGIAAGQRYQFRSSDSSNTLRMISHFRNAASGAIDVHGTQIPYVRIAGVQLLCVAHSDTTEVAEGYNENYISMLRDRVAEQSDVFERSSLLIIHNSLLDTIVNSAIDLAGNRAPWSTPEVRSGLLRLAGEKKQSRKVYDCLLEWQSVIIADEGDRAGEAARAETLRWSLVVLGLARCPQLLAPLVQTSPPRP